MHQTLKKPLRVAAISGVLTGAFIGMLALGPMGPCGPASPLGLIALMLAAISASVFGIASFCVIFLALLNAIGVKKKNGSL